MFFQLLAQTPTVDEIVDNIVVELVIIALNNVLRSLGV